jgi:serine/threonine protein kinase
VGRIEAETELNGGSSGRGGEPGESFGPYRLIKPIGHGGMGTVYLAVRDDEFRRRVAVKVLRIGMDSASILARFRQERQILAALQHPYIASLLDGGTTPQGQPYFAMEVSKGSRYHKLGNQLGNPNYPNVGDHQGALENLERSEAVLRKGAELYPSNAVFTRNLGVVHSNISDVLLALKRTDEALARQRMANTAFRSLSEVDPADTAAKNDLAISTFKN